MIENIAVAEALAEQAEVSKETTATKAVQWAADHYKIGDCLKAMQQMSPGIVHFAEVDPPYAINLGEHRRDTKDIGEYNEVSIEDYPKFLKTAASSVYRVLYDHAFCVWWFGPSWYAEVLATLRDVGFHVDEIPGIWNKQGVGTTTGNLDTYLARGYEPFFICRKGKPPIRKRGRSNVFDFQGVSTAERIHPTERPLELVREILRTFAYPKARVMSPFLGSGNTIVASYLEEMIGFGWDLSEHYKERYLARVLNFFPPTEEAENESE
jgi:site-specific DNA-methyltransferase (adenine-specific)